MKRTIFCSMLLTLGVTLALSAQASGSFVNDYYACAKFLRMNPSQQQEDFIPGRLSFEQFKQSCRQVVRRGLRDAIAKDRREARGYESRDRNDDSGYTPAPNFHDSCSGTPESINCTNHGPGSIYDQAGCNQNPSSANCN